MNLWLILATWIVPVFAALVAGYRLGHTDQAAVIATLRRRVDQLLAERAEALETVDLALAEIDLGKP